MDTECRTCNKRILRHAYHIRCALCRGCYHLKCITLIPEEIEQLKCTSTTWYCRSCNSDIFPYNNIEDNNEFLNCLKDHHLQDCGINLPTDDLLFQPFDLDKDLHDIPNGDVDPDVNFYY